MVQATPLPQFTNPPISEVAIGVAFSPLSEWKSAHAGLYWREILDRFPETETHPAIPSSVEQFGDAFWQSQMPTIEISEEAPQIRQWFLNSNQTELIQLQRDKFVINWRKFGQSISYPRYDQYLRPRWSREWAQFCGFVEKTRLGTVNVRQCELTYVNDIPQGEGWGEIADALRLFSFVTFGGATFLPMPETILSAVTYEMPNQCGRLHVSLRHLVRRKDEKRVLQLRLTARGDPSSSSEADLLKWFDCGREWIVRGFTDLTSPEAHHLWGRTT